MNQEIYVRLIDETVDVYRPVVARRLTADEFEIVEQRYPRDLERWEFEPGARVRCEELTLNEGPPVLVARRQI